MKNIFKTTSFRNFFTKIKTRKIDQMAANRQLVEYIRTLEEQIIELDERLKKLEPDAVTKRNELIEKIKKLRKEGWSLGAIGLKLGIDDSMIRSLWAEIKKEEPDVGVGIEPKDE